MNRNLTAAALGLVMLAFFAVAASAADDPALNKELIGVLTAQNLPRGKITNVSKQAERDYLVACQDKSNYQIVADSQGKLVAHTLGQKIH